MCVPLEQMVCATTSLTPSTGDSPPPREVPCRHLSVVRVEALEPDPLPVRSPEVQLFLLPDVPGAPVPDARVPTHAWTTTRTSPRTPPTHSRVTILGFPSLTPSPTRLRVESGRDVLGRDRRSRSRVKVRPSTSPTPPKESPWSCKLTDSPRGRSVLSRGGDHGGIRPHPLGYREDGTR